LSGQIDYFGSAILVVAIVLMGFLHTLIQRANKGSPGIKRHPKRNPW
jgi:hypothetical protein